MKKFIIFLITVALFACKGEDIQPLEKYTISLKTKFLSVEEESFHSSLKTGIPNGNRILNLLILVHEKGNDDFKEKYEGTLDYKTGINQTEDVIFYLPRGDYDIYAFAYNDNIIFENDQRNGHSKDLNIFQVEGESFRFEHDKVGDFWMAKDSIENGSMGSKRLLLKRFFGCVRVNVHVNNPVDMSWQQIDIIGRGYNSFSYLDSLSYYKHELIDQRVKNNSFATDEQFDFFMFPNYARSIKPSLLSHKWIITNRYLINGSADTVTEQSLFMIPDLKPNQRHTATINLR